MSSISDIAKKITDAGGIISGSYALKLQGFLPDSREAHDLDVVIHGTPKEVLEKLEKALGVSVEGVQSEEEYKGDLLRFTVDGVRVDVFPKNSPVRTDKNNASLLHTYDTLVAKLQILLDRLDKKDDTYFKHLADFDYIFRIKK